MSRGLGDVYKRQILLNSYYFLNNSVLSKPIEDVVGKNWYVKDANWESTIAHEMGHYISFKLLLKENNVDNITFVTNSNEDLINSIIKKFDNQSKIILHQTTEQVNTKRMKNEQK